MQIFTLRRDSSNNTGVLFICHLCHLRVGYHWVTGGGQSREGQTGRVSIFTHFVFVTWFGDNYARMYLQLMVIYIIYTLLHILRDLEPFPTTTPWRDLAHNNVTSRRHGPATDPNTTVGSLTPGALVGSTRALHPRDLMQTPFPPSSDTSLIPRGL